MEKGEYYSINQRFKKMRKSLGLTQEQLGEVLGLDRTGLSQIENGKRLPTFEMILKIVIENNISADWFFYGIGNMHINSSSNYKNEDNILIINETDKKKEYEVNNFQHTVLKKMDKLIELMENKNAQ